MVMTYKVGISQRKICGGVELKYYCIFVRGVLMIPMILGDAARDNYAEFGEINR